MCLPVYFNEPTSALQKIAEELEYSHLLDEVQHASTALSVNRILMSENVLPVTSATVLDIGKSDHRAALPAV